MSAEEIYLERIYDGIRQEAAGYQMYGIKLLELVQEISTLVSTQIPDLSKEINQVLRDIQELTEYTDVFVAEQMRASEDVRDISERYKVVTRISHEYAESKSIYESTSEIYEQCLEKNADERTIQFRKEKKRESLTQLKSKLATYITATEKFYAFRDRRMSSAVMTYLHAAHAFHTHESCILKRIKNSVASMRASKLAVPPTVEQFLQEFNEFKATAMTPEPHPVFGRFIIS